MILGQRFPRRRFGYAQRFDQSPMQQVEQPLQCKLMSLSGGGKQPIAEGYETPEGIITQQ